MSVDYLRFLDVYEASQVQAQRGWTPCTCPACLLGARVALAVSEDLEVLAYADRVFEAAQGRTEDLI